MAIAAAPEISGFRALSPLGYGPTSTIYSAQGLTLGRWVALTVYSTVLPNERSQRRFARSFDVARRLGAHPNVVTMLESGTTFERQPWIATEIYERGTLQSRVENRQPLPVDEVLHMGILLAGALETAHRAEVVHGGIHPARVLISHDGDPALADLGLVPLVDKGGLAALVGPGSFHAPPEVLEAGAMTPATDVYALASTLYTALTTCAPYQRDADDTTAALLVRILQHDVPPIGRRDVPASLEDALRRALSSEPQHRPGRVLAFARELQSCQQELGLPVSQPVVLDVSASIRLAVADTGEPRLTVAPVVEQAPPSQVQRVFVPAPEESVPAPTPAPAAPAAPAPAPAAPAPAAAAPAPVLPPPPPVAAPAPPEAASVALALAPPPPAPVDLPAQSFDNLGTVPGVDEAASPRHESPFGSLRTLDLRPGDNPDRPAEGSEPDGPAIGPTARALPVIVLVALVVVLGAGLAWAVTTHDPAESDQAADPDEPTDSTPVDDGDIVPVPVTAVENASGVQLDWDGGAEDSQVVLLLSENEAPRLLPASTGTALLVPTSSLKSTNGYCFAVTSASRPTPSPALIAAKLPAEALVPEGCIRGASPDSVRLG